MSELDDSSGYELMTSLMVLERTLRKLVKASRQLFTTGNHYSNFITIGTFAQKSISCRQKSTKWIQRVFLTYLSNTVKAII